MGITRDKSTYSSWGAPSCTTYCSKFLSLMFLLPRHLQSSEIRFWIDFGAVRLEKRAAMGHGCSAWQAHRLGVLVGLKMGGEMRAINFENWDFELQNERFGRWFFLFKWGDFQVYVSFRGSTCQSEIQWIKIWNHSAEIRLAVFWKVYNLKLRLSNK